MLIEEQENLEAGMPPDKAHYAALRHFGNVALAEQRTREMWKWNSIETFSQVAAVQGKLSHFLPLNGRPDR